MSSNLSEQFSQYSRASVSVCMLTVASLAIIMIFVISPIGGSFLASSGGKIAAFCILGYAAYQNIQNSNTLSAGTGTSFFSGSWDLLKTNLVCSYLFSCFIVLLMFFLLQRSLVKSS